MLSKHRQGERGCTKAGRGREEEGSHGKRGWKASEWIPCSLDGLGGAPEEMVVVRGQEGMLCKRLCHLPTK